MTQSVICFPELFIGFHHRPDVFNRMGPVVPGGIAEIFSPAPPTPLPGVGRAPRGEDGPDLAVLTPFNFKPRDHCRLRLTNYSRRLRYSANGTPKRLSAAS